MEAAMQPKKGGLRTMPFIFANEIAEKLAVVGFSANMISYLTKELHMPLAKAATTVTNFGGAASLTPLLGAFLADAYLGRFWTIVIASVIYQLGMTLLTVSAALPALRPPPCAARAVCAQASSPQLAVLYLSLLLKSLGAGGIRPCVVAFGADQFDQGDKTQKAEPWNFFNWYYFCLGLSMLVAVTAVVYVQDNVSWALGLGIPAAAMAASLIFFFAGSKLYRRLEPAGSPFTRLLQVAVAAARKRRLPRVDDSTLLYENPELDAPISLDGRLLHTNSLVFLDKAAVATAAEAGEKQPDLWRLSTVHRVEELKSLLRMGPIWAAGIAVVTAAAQQGTFTLQQARAMDRHLTATFQVPPASMAAFTLVAMLATIAISDRAPGPRLGYLSRMGLGYAVSAAATLLAGFVEVRRRAAGSAAPLSALWLVPQYALHGAAEGLAAVGHLEFLYDQCPETMRSSAAALFWLAAAAGNYLSSLLVYAVHRFRPGWLADDLDRGRLELFYWLVTAVQVVNLAYYLAVARCYTFKRKGFNAI
ncbi:major facilitator superfamily protein [Wolffia australiana]